MNEGELGRLLGDSFDARARAAVPDAAPVPPPRFADPYAESARTLPSSGRRRTLALVAAPLLAAAAVVGVVAAVFVPSGGGRTAPIAGAGSSAARPSGTSSASAADVPRPGSGRTVRITLLNEPGATVGVGMPVRALFSTRFSEAADLSRATTVSVNGVPADGVWYFAPATGHPGYAIEGHLRPQGFWPAHAQVQVTVAARGVTGGRDFVFGNAVTLAFRTGAANIATVDDRTHRLTLATDGQVIARYPVSLGTSATPTSRGTKVVVSKGDPICLTGPGYHECGIKYTQRLTDSGEYLVSAPWNASNIGKQDVSNGCTDLLPADAQALFSRLRVGDVVDFPDATGAPVRFGDGLGDWDVPWSTWLTGGAIPTR